MKKTIIRLAIGAVLFVIAIMVPAEPYLLKLAVYLAAYLEIGYKVLWKAIRNISRGKVFDENFLMAGVLRSGPSQRANFRKQLRLCFSIRSGNFLRIMRSANPENPLRSL